MLDKSEIRIEELNDTYYRMADLIGIDDTIRLAEALTGCRMTFKKEYDLELDYHEVVECIGKAKTIKLIRGFYGERVYFSDMKTALRPQIYTKIINEFTGYNHRQLAQKYGYSLKQIQRITAKQRKG